MKNIKVVCFDDLRSPKYDENEERAYGKGLEPCAICGRGIVDRTKVAGLRIIGGGQYFTEYDGEEGIDPAGDMYWFTVGDTCYKKFKKLEKVIEIKDGESI